MPFLLLPILAMLAAAVLTGLALIKKQYGVAKIGVSGAATWATVYLIILLTVSLTSREKLLRLNEEKAFCGFYLDCHLHVSLIGVDRTKTLGTEPNQKTTNGNFYVVSVKISSDAKQATLQPYNLQVVALDGNDRKYERVLEAETVLEQAENQSVPLEQSVSPRGGFYVKKVVFDLPMSARNPKLLVTEGWWAERLLELFNIGDEDSFLHKKVFFQLG